MQNVSLSLARRSRRLIAVPLILAVLRAGALATRGLMSSSKAATTARAKAAGVAARQTRGKNVARRPGGVGAVLVRIRHAI